MFFSRRSYKLSLSMGSSHILASKLENKYFFKFETSHFIFRTKAGWEVGGLESLRLRLDGKWVVLNAPDETSVG